MAKKTANISTGALKACFILATIYVLEMLFLPVNHASVIAYHTSALDFRLLDILVNLPIVIVWFVAFWGYSRLSSYARILGSAPEAAGYTTLSKGLSWLAWVLPITSIIDRFLSGLSNHQPKLHTSMTIISNYFNLVLPLLAFIIIFVAAKMLLRGQKWKTDQPKSPLFMAVFLLGGALYCYLILRTADLSNLSNSSNIYKLPNWLVIISLVIPYLYGWFLGLLASYQLNLFSLRTPGVLYKRALSYLSSGLIAVILSFIVTQYLAAVWPSKTHLVFNLHLAIVILFRVIGGVGFILLAIGANKLKMIEEV
jgi:hypothetical protein